MFIPLNESVRLTIPDIHELSHRNDYNDDDDDDDDDDHTERYTTLRFMSWAPIMYTADSIYHSSTSEHTHHHHHNDASVHRYTQCPPAA